MKNMTLFLSMEILSAYQGHLELCYAACKLRRSIQRRRAHRSRLTITGRCLSSATPPRWRSNLRCAISLFWTLHSNRRRRVQAAESSSPWQRVSRATENACLNSFCCWLRPLCTSAIWNCRHKERPPRQSFPPSLCSCHRRHGDQCFALRAFRPECTWRPNRGRFAVSLQLRNYSLLHVCLVATFALSYFIDSLSLRFKNVLSLRLLSVLVLLSFMRTWSENERASLLFSRRPIGGIIAATLAPSGGLFAAAGHNKHVYIWSVTETLEWTLSWHRCLL